MTATADRLALLDLGVRFGKQVRLKCTQCRKFVAGHDGDITCTSCGARYVHHGDTFFTLVRPR